MGKNTNGGSSSWLSAVKKAFRSPSKETSDKRSCRSEDLEQQEQEKKRGKRRWIFGKSLSHDREKNHTVKVTNSVGPRNDVIAGTVKTVMEAETAEEEKRRAIEVAIATTTAAEAAVATAQAAVQFIRMSKPFISVRENQAAVIIQKAFKGYLARKALNALKGLVKLQALARGHNVRKRTTLTLARMQAVIRVQARVCDQRRRLSVSREGSLNSSCFTDKNQMSKDGESDENQSVEKEIDSFSMPGMIKDVERDLAYTFSDKIWSYRMGQNSGSGRPAKSEWTDHCKETNPWDRPGRYSCDQRTPIKILQVDEPDRRDPYQHTRFSSYLNQYEPRKSLPVTSFGSPLKPYGPELKYLQVHSASPRCLREESSYPKSKTPSLGSFRPSYMAETESAKARARSQSVPRHQRPSTPEREATGIAKRRLFFGASAM
ncbi:hypothetical protein KSS87_011697 [Heliosperma pusillum]|nr:hypothetical protein KSS87_011697 [Heliosperma pusillum]